MAYGRLNLSLLLLILLLSNLVLTVLYCFKKSE